jgi:hypothetical protein
MTAPDVAKRSSGLRRDAVRRGGFETRPYMRPAAAQYRAAP